MRKKNRAIPRPAFAKNAKFNLHARVAFQKVGVKEQPFLLALLRVELASYKISARYGARKFLPAVFRRPQYDVSSRGIHIITVDKIKLVFRR